MPALRHPWWLGYFIDNCLRRLLHNPAKIVGPFVKPGMTVMDVGCGMGMFSIAMAKMVGGSGLVIAVDLQQKMLDVLQDRAGRLQRNDCRDGRLATCVDPSDGIAAADTLAPDSCGRPGWNSVVPTGESL